MPGSHWDTAQQNEQASENSVLVIPVLLLNTFPSDQDMTAPAGQQRQYRENYELLLKHIDFLKCWL